MKFQLFLSAAILASEYNCIFAGSNQGTNLLGSFESWLQDKAQGVENYANSAISNFKQKASPLVKEITDAALSEACTGLQKVSQNNNYDANEQTLLKGIAKATCNLASSVANKQSDASAPGDDDDDSANSMGTGGSGMGDNSSGPAMGSSRAGNSNMGSGNGRKSGSGPVTPPTSNTGSGSRANRGNNRGRSNANTGTSGANFDY